MGRHRNNPQMKEKEDYPENELREIEASDVIRYRVQSNGYKDVQ